jgi:hypothetical protein
MAYAYNASAFPYTITYTKSGDAQATTFVFNVSTGREARMHACILLICWPPGACAFNQDFILTPRPRPMHQPLS